MGIICQGLAKNPRGVNVKLNTAHHRDTRGSPQRAPTRLCVLSFQSFSTQVVSFATHNQWP